jgi:hypothetical protein
MKNLILLFIALSTSLFASEPLTANFTTGNPQVKSINALTFGPEGILFIGDSEAGAIVALKTDDAKQEGAIDIKNVDQVLSALLGTPANQINIVDMAVNPISGKVYLAVSTPTGGSLLFRSKDKTFENIALETVSFSKTSLTNPISIDKKDRRGQSMRNMAISDLQYFKGKILVSGLSNDEFSSSLRSIDFPFNEAQKYSTLEIYHANHAKYETLSPIKTFLPYTLNGKDMVVASYTCTPLVLFPIDELAAGKHLKGKTVAELGNRNTPLDIISVKIKGKEYFIMANTSRALMKIDPEKVANTTNFLTTPAEETAGVEFINLPYVNVLQLDKVNDENVIALQRKANGDLDLMTLQAERL